MTQYIDKSTIVAEIDNRIYRRKKEYNILKESEIWEDALKLKERINELVDLRTQILFNTLDSLEMKEVDLEKCKEYDKALSIAKSWYKSSDSSAQERNVALMIMGEKVREPIKQKGG